MDLHCLHRDLFRYRAEIVTIQHKITRILGNAIYHLPAKISIINKLEIKVKNDKIYGP